MSNPTTLESWKWNTIWGGGITDKYNPGWARDLWKFWNIEQWEESTSKQVKVLIALLSSWCANSLLFIEIAFLEVLLENY